MCNYLDCKFKVMKLIGECKYCKGTFCTFHRLPEVHSCVKLEEYCIKQREILKNKLYDERVPKMVHFNLN